MTRTNKTLLVTLAWVSVGACLKPATYGECAPSAGNQCDIEDSGTSAEGDTGGLHVDDAACEDAAAECEGTDLLVCESDRWTSHDCEDVCLSYGYEAEGCVAGLCLCTDPLDDECSLGIQVFCTCAPDLLGSACTSETVENLYAECWQRDHGPMRCLASHVSGGLVECNFAFEECL